MQKWDSEQYAQHARFVSDLGGPVVDLLDPKPGERVLDLGCGDGALTERLVSAGCEVVAVDSSPEQVWAALERGLDARIVDVSELSLDGLFDGVFSNAALHLIKDPKPVIANVWNALRPGGRFVAEFGGAGCVATIREALASELSGRGIDAQSLDPWYFPTPQEYGVRLESQGFRVDLNILFPRPTPLPSDIRSWLEIFAQPYISRVAEPRRPSLIEAVRTRLEPQLLNADGVWVVDYVQLRVAATKPS
jgi:trans-aconitate methyltransferase